MINFYRMRYLMDRVPKLLWDTERAEANATRITSNITGMPKGGSMNRQEDSYITLAEVRDAYREANEELTTMLAELMPQIDALDDVDEKAVMRLRYLQGRKPDEIAIMLGKSRRGVYYFLTRAERKINRIQQNA